MKFFLLAGLIWLAKPCQRVMRATTALVRYRRPTGLDPQSSKSAPSPQQIDLTSEEPQSTKPHSSTPPSTSPSNNSSQQSSPPSSVPTSASTPDPSASTTAPIHPLPTPPTTSPNMSPEAALRQTLRTLSSSPTSPQAASLLREAKKHLMNLNALIPSSQTPQSALPLARATLEAGALLSIRAQDPDAFTRYYQQLQPFYELPASAYPPTAEVGANSQRSKMTGLYLILLLTKGDYAAFHTLLEGLELEREGAATTVSQDKFLQYPVMLEQWLMEGAYDRVWEAARGEGVPSEEFGVFSEVLIGTIRAEIASCSEKAYPSIPVANAKNLLFLESEGAVVSFAEERGWVVRNSRIYFPIQGGDAARSEKEILVASGQVIENTIGYARELETIV